MAISIGRLLIGATLLRNAKRENTMFLVCNSVFIFILSDDS